MSATRELKKTSIFSGDFDLSQLMHHIDPADIRPIYDRVLVKEIPESEVHGSLVLPESAVNRQKDAGLRIGLVVAVGKGDKWIEIGFPMGKQEPVRKSIHRRSEGKCDRCHGDGYYAVDLGDIGDMCDVTCPVCGGDGHARLRMQVKPGNRVIFDRRREAEIYIGDARYCIIHEEQSIWAILE